MFSFDPPSNSLISVPDACRASWAYAGFFWTFRKKLKARKTQAEKKLKKVSEKLKQIIPKLNNLPTKNWFIAQKSPEVDIFCTKICPNLRFSTKWSLKLGKFRKFLTKFPFFWINSRNFQKNSRIFFKKLKVLPTRLGF